MSHLFQSIYYLTPRGICQTQIRSCHCPVLSIINSYVQGCTRNNSCLPLQPTIHFTLCSPTIHIFLSGLQRHHTLKDLRVAMHTALSGTLFPNLLLCLTSDCYSVPHLNRTSPVLLACLSSSCYYNNLLFSYNNLLPLCAQVLALMHLSING